MNFLLFFLRTVGRRCSWRIFLIALVALLAGCGKQDSAVVPNNALPQSPMAREVYRSFDGRTRIEIISPDECEISDGAAILLCKYSRQPQSLRVVATASGTNQVLYYQFTPQGLEDNKGRVLFSPRQYELAVEQVEAAKKQQQAEKERIQAVVKASETPEREIGRYALSYRNRGSATLRLSDVDITIEEDSRKILFKDIWNISRQEGFSHIVVSDSDKGNFEFDADTPTGNAFGIAAKAAIEAWRLKWHSVPQVKRFRVEGFEKAADEKPINQKATLE